MRVCGATTRTTDGRCSHPVGSAGVCAAGHRTGATAGTAAGGLGADAAVVAGADPFGSPDPWAGVSDSEREYVVMVYAGRDDSEIDEDVAYYAEAVASWVAPPAEAGWEVVVAQEDVRLDNKFGLRAAQIARRMRDAGHL